MKITLHQLDLITPPDHQVLQREATVAEVVAEDHLVAEQVVEDHLEAVEDKTIL